MNSFLRWCAGGVLVCFHAASMGQVGLYSTGPAEDAAFIRFLNTTSVNLLVSADGQEKAITITPEDMVSPFLSADARQPIKGALTLLETKQPLNLQLEPSEFVTVLVQDGMDAQVIREKVEDFNALKASVAFYNGDPLCSAATVKVQNRETVVFENLKPGELARREINPIPLSLSLFCNDEQTAESLDLGRLQPGERYSLFVLPMHQEQRFFSVLDEISF